MSYPSFLFLGQTFFNTRGEPREAVVALSMLQQGNWVLPVNNGVELAFKPPFFHWCIAAISTVAGAVNEYTSRMPSALALSAMVLVGYVFYAKRRGAEVAFIAALLTLTNFEVHRAGVACRVDMVLTAMMVIALYQLYKWGRERPERRALGGRALLECGGPDERAGRHRPALPCACRIPVDQGTEVPTDIFLFPDGGRVGLRVAGRMVLGGLSAGW